MSEAFVLGRSKSMINGNGGNTKQRLVTEIFNSNKHWVVPWNIVNNIVDVLIFGAGTQGSGWHAVSGTTTLTIRGGNGGAMNNEILELLPGEDIDITISSGITSFGTYLSANAGQGSTGGYVTWSTSGSVAAYYGGSGFRSRFINPSTGGSKPNNDSFSSGNSSVYNNKSTYGIGHGNTISSRLTADTNWASNGIDISTWDNIPYDESLIYKGNGRGGYNRGGNGGIGGLGGNNCGGGGGYGANGGFWAGGGGGIGGDGGNVIGGGGGYGRNALGGSYVGGGGGYFSRGGDGSINGHNFNITEVPSGGWAATVSTIPGGGGGYGDGGSIYQNAGYGAGGAGINCNKSYGSVTASQLASNNGGSGICIIQYYIKE